MNIRIKKLKTISGKLRLIIYNGAEYTKFNLLRKLLN